MMPDLGDFTVEVLTAYGLSIFLMVVVTAMSVRRARKVRAQLAAVETRKDHPNV